MCKVHADNAGLLFCTLLAQSHGQDIVLRVYKIFNIKRKLLQHVTYDKSSPVFADVRTQSLN
jgi:hypothetical protein